MVNGVRDQLRSIIFTGSAALGAVFFLLLFIHIVIRRGLHECQGKAVFDFSV